MSVGRSGTTPEHATRRLAIGLAVFWILAALAQIPLALVYDLSASFEQSLVWQPPIYAFGVVGLLILTSRPRHAVGWIATWMAVLGGASMLLSAFAVGPFEGTRAGSWLGAATQASNTLAIAVTLPAVLLLFPDGRLLTRRWRRVAAVIPLAALIGATAAILTGGWGGDSEQTIAPPPLSDELVTVGRGLSNVFFPVFLLLLAAGGVSLVLRYRRSTGKVRRQLRWLELAGAYLALVVLSDVFLDYGQHTVVSRASLSDVLISSAFTFVPVAIGIAILRHGLYDIDVVISRTVAFGVLAGFITVVYAAIVVGLGSLLGGG
ncbi:MAG: hypothetical protein R3343_00910, partial [Nitriliruptorales bacterium]|nr:hypothetical protein [Nitriliruptorales bacterium]